MAEQFGKVNDPGAAAVEEVRGESLPGTDPAEEFRMREEKLAQRVINYTRDQLIAYMPFFNRAILRMPAVFYSEETGTADIPDGFGTNGKKVFASPGKVVAYYRDMPERLPRVFLHMIFHCIFSHPFRYDRLHMHLWDIVSDIAVENAVLELNWKEAALPADRERRRFIDTLRPKVEAVTAENLYHYFFEHPKEQRELEQHEELFFEDLHHFWTPAELVGEKMVFSDEEVYTQDSGLTQEWEQIGRNVQLDVQAFEKNQENVPGVIIENIKQVFRERYNYAEFLKKFIASSEEMRVNQDEFDYIYYTYGMDLYGNMPLIEPLEYREDNRIRDLVIAIDTSGSCSGWVVKSFLNKTCTILKTAGSFFKNVNIHIIQCDCRVQKDTAVRSEEEFDRVMEDFELVGFGGTDFRPVFEYVDEMVKKKEFHDLRGLIYFTDGLGTFPKQQPACRTAFVVMHDTHKKPKIPAWAIKMIIHGEDLRGEQ